MVSGPGRASTPDPRRLRDLVRSWIVLREIDLDAVLTDDDVMTRTGAGKADVRAAMDRLAEEGILTLSGHYTAKICLPPLQQLRETDELRTSLEGLAARRFIQNASAAQLAALRAAAEEFRTLAETSAEPAELLRARDRFYYVLLRGARGMNTISLLTELRTRIAVIICAGLAEPGRAVEMADELREIYDALAAKDKPRAAAACARHIDRSSSAGLRRMSPSV